MKHRIMLKIKHLLSMTLKTQAFTKLSRLWMNPATIHSDHLSPLSLNHTHKEVKPVMLLFFLTYTSHRGALISFVRESIMCKQRHMCHLSLHPHDG